MVSSENPEAVAGIKEDDDAENIHRTSPDRVEHYSKMNRPDVTGASWIEEEYNQLDEQYGSGMKISKMDCLCVSREEFMRQLKVDCDTIGEGQNLGE